MRLDSLFICFSILKSSFETRQPKLISGFIPKSAHAPSSEKVTSVGIAKCPNSSTWIQDLTSPFGAPGFVCQPGTQIPSVGRIKPLLCRCLKPDQGNLTLQRICLLLCLLAFIRIAVHSTVQNLHIKRPKYGMFLGSQQVSGQLWRNLMVQQGIDTRGYKLPQIFLFQTLESHNSLDFEGCSQSIPCSLDRPSTALNVSCGAVIPVLVCLFFLSTFHCSEANEGILQQGWWSSPTTTQL